MVGDAEARAPVVVVRVPESAIVAVRAGVRHGAESAVWVFLLEIVCGHAVVALRGSGLKIPTQAEIDRELGGGAPVILRVERDVRLAESCQQICAGADPPEARTRKQSG